MVKPKTLPLGIDVGRSRIRVAHAEIDEEGRPRLISVAVRKADGELGATIRSALEELACAERRCVFGLDEPAALIRIATFPKMNRSERDRAARYEAARFIDSPIDEVSVRVAPLLMQDGVCAIGIVRRDAIASVKAAARRAKLRPIAIDSNSLALRRSIPGSDAIVDIGTQMTLLHTYGRRIPTTQTFSTGGSKFTAAIAESLGIDNTQAERRKHAHGLAGSGAYALDTLIESITSAIIEIRASGRAEMRGISLVGNGSRLVGFATELERASAIPTRLATFAPDVSRTLPPDVLRASAPDWATAFGLALWATTS